ncbi:MAG: SOS response-associated peptidase family protein [Gammaproteobacteria bacterium]|nr:SOS response-associated peptidase family protein [Gammaproteobacteria bacterium]
MWEGRTAFKKRRNLIPASGFFEWEVEKDGKQPYCFRPSKAPQFSFAGLYGHWDNKAGKSIDS